MMKIHKFKFDQFKFCNNNMQIYYANIPSIYPLIFVIKRNTFK